MDFILRNKKTNKHSSLVKYQHINQMEGYFSSNIQMFVSKNFSCKFTPSIQTSEEFVIHASFIWKFLDKHFFPLFNLGWQYRLMTNEGDCCGTSASWLAAVYCCHPADTITLLTARQPVCLWTSTQLHKSGLLVMY